jgi:hypothetical protein
MHENDIFLMDGLFRRFKHKSSDSLSIGEKKQVAEMLVNELETDAEKKAQVNVRKGDDPSSLAALYVKVRCCLYCQKARFSEESRKWIKSIGHLQRQNTILRGH